MINRLILLALATLLVGCGNTPTVASDEPSLRGTITGISRQGSDGSTADSLGTVRTVVVRPLATADVGLLGRCYRDAVLTISRSTRVRRSSGETVGADALALGQVVSVWAEPTFPVTSVCRPGTIAAVISIESDSPL